MGSWSCTCNSFCTNNWSCTCHTDDNSNYPLISYPFADDPCIFGTIIEEQHHDELRTAINEELSRRSKAFGITNVSTGQKPLYTHFRELRDAINHCVAWGGYPASLGNAALSAGQDILTDAVNQLRIKINSYRVICICNCDYCTCDCNYCTCNCNQCVCNCNYCTCNCNYSCTCNCNYSDKRLKKNIIYL